GDVPLARVGPRAQRSRGDLERLKRLAAIVAVALSAPGERHVVMIDGPGAGHVDARAGRCLPASSAGDLPMVPVVLFAVSIRVPRARREPAAEHRGAVRPGHIAPALQPGAGAEPP